MTGEASEPWTSRSGVEVLTTRLHTPPHADNSAQINYEERNWDCVGFITTDKALRTLTRLPVASESILAHAYI